MNSVQRPDSFEVADYTGVLRRRWPIVVVVACLGLIGALGYVVVTPKLYSATAQVYVSPTGADLASQLANSRTQGTVNLDTEAQIVQSGLVATLAGKMMHSPLTPYKLRQDVSVSVPANSQVLDITCQASTGKGAATCANDFAAAYLQNRSATAATYISQQLQPLLAKVNQLQKADSSLNSTIDSLPSNSSQRLAAEAQLSSNTNQLNNLNSQVATLYSDASKTNGGRVTTAASTPGSPSDPKKTLVLPSGLISGLVIGLLGAFIWDRRDKRIHTARDAERFFGLPTLIDLAKTGVGRQVSLASPRSRAGRAFVDLAHSVASSLGEGSHVVLVAGVSPGPAVSVVAANLAATLARTHSEAVLVCAALQDSVAPEMFGLADGPGLTEVLAGRITVSEVARGPASAPGLWVIPPGADTSLADYNLQYDTAKALTAQLRRDARYVIIEVQASEDGADTFALAEFADAAVLTVETQRTTRKEGDACIGRLARMRTKILGTAALPAVKPGVTVRPQPGQQRTAVGAGDHRRETEGRPETDPLGYGTVPSLSGTAANSKQDRDARRPARTPESYDPADRISGN